MPGERSPRGVGSPVAPILPALPHPLAPRTAPFAPFGLDFPGPRLLLRRQDLPDGRVTAAARPSQPGAAPAAAALALRLGRERRVGGHRRRQDEGQPHAERKGSGASRLTAYRTAPPESPDPDEPDRGRRSGLRRPKSQEPAAQPVARLDEPAGRSILLVRRDVEGRLQSSRERFETRGAAAVLQRPDHVVIDLNGEIGRERDETPVERAVVENAQRDAVVRSVGTVGIGGGQDVRALDESKLHAAHGAAMVVSVKHAIPEVCVSKRPARGQDGVAARFGHRGCYRVFVRAIRLRADAAQNLDFAGEPAAGMQRLQIVDVRTEEGGLEYDDEFPVPLVVRGETVGGGLQERGLAKLDRGRRPD